MPTIVDSLFLELGIDSSKFSKDQQKSLDLIHKFESQATRSAKNAVKTVGQAFRDLSKESSVGASVAHLENLSKKLKELGQAARVSGGAGTPFGVMAEGLGMLLSPAALGIAAVGLLGKGMWDLNKNMTATNATMYRQAQLSGMNATNLWDWGEAARTVGANPQEVTGAIAGLQTAVLGMGIGAGDATAQLVSLARLGVGFNFRTGVDIPKLFERVHAMARASGYQNLGALRALTGPVMNDAMFGIATNPSYSPADLKNWIKGKEAANTGEILRKSLESQTVLGKYGIMKDVLAETAYGGEQGLLQAVVEILTKILDGVSSIADFFLNPGKALDATGAAVVNAGGWLSSGMKRLFGRSPASSADMARAMKTLMGAGLSENDAAAMVGNMAQESSMNPLATNASGHMGLMQWSRQRQADFARRYGYPMGWGSVPASKQFGDQLMFARDELQSTQQKAASGMAKMRSLMGKTGAFMGLDEAPGDNSLTQRYAFALQAKQLAEAANARSGSVSSTVTSETHIGDVHIHTPSTDPADHADAFIEGINNQPLISPSALGVMSLATRGMAQ